ncbi:MAG TPA: UDP-N-acetylmuramoyl-L-alanine--D-glutamate ligase, partial [Tepidisphaeraceae bacterium]
MPQLRNQRVTVMGLGRFGGGIAVARWLANQGARVLVTDKDPADKLADSVRQLAGLPIDFRLGEHREDDFRSADLVVASPAVPLTNQYLQTARAAGVPISTEMRLFVERCPARRTVGVTGTKGKSTTTAMLGTMLAKKFKTLVGGNIGKSLLDDLPRIGCDDVVVLELSSFMLEHLRAMRWSPHVAVITMIAQDHLDWHGSVEAYVQAKRVLLEFQKPTDFAVLNATCSRCRELARTSPAQVRLFGQGDAKPFDLKLPGVHNQVNAQGAFIAANCLGVTHAEAQAALNEFKPLPHRLELVHEERGVRFYNDSIATIPEAAVAALESFPANKVIQIVGGRQKDLPLALMCQALASRAKAVLCIGEKGPEIARAVREATSNGTPTVQDCADLNGAIRAARQLAQPGDIVLLSTGCKSYDQFINFEQRGEAFAR